MTSTNAKYNVLINYINTPTDANFDKIAAVFKTDINNIVHSKVYDYEYDIFGDEIANKTLLVLWNRLKGFKLDSNPQIAVSSFVKYVKNIVGNISKREKSEHFKRQTRYMSIDEGVGNSPDSDSSNTFDKGCEDNGFKRYEISDFVENLKNSLPVSKRKDFEMLIDFVVGNITTEEICEKYNISYSHIFLRKHRIKEELRKILAS